MSSILSENVEHVIVDPWLTVGAQVSSLDRFV